MVLWYFFVHHVIASLHETGSAQQKGAGIIGAWVVDPVNETGRAADYTPAARGHMASKFFAPQPAALPPGAGQTPQNGVCPKGDCKAGGR